VALLLVLLGTPGCDSAQGPDVSSLVDHHVHLLSPQLVKDWKALGANFSRPDSAYTSVVTLLGPPDSTSPPRPGMLGGAVLVPMAHAYSRDDFRGPLRLTLATEQQAVRRENDYVAAEAARYPGRAIALCGVDFLRPYAWNEIQRCRRELGSAGIKLHLGSAGTDLRNAGHLAALRRIAELAEAERLILLIHFDPQSDRAAVADVDRFIEVVLQPFPELTVVIAHLGGSGSYGPWTRAILGAFYAWLKVEDTAGRPRTGVFFDISAAWLARDSEGLPRTSGQEIEALSEDLVRYGTSRLLFGSDYPVFDPKGYAPGFRRVTGISPEAWDTLVHNRVPGFPASPSR